MLGSTRRRRCATRFARSSRRVAPWPATIAAARGGAECGAAISPPDH